MDIIPTIIPEPELSNAKLLYTYITSSAIPETADFNTYNPSQSKSKFIK